MVGTDTPSSSSTGHEYEDIAIQVENDVTAKIGDDEDDESIILIPRVPEILREGANGAYDPHVISIGPYHWGKLRLKAREKHKRHYLQKFLNRNRKRCLRYYIKEIQSLELRMRSCYEKDIEMTSKDFVEMMLLDACFVVEFILQMWEGALIPDENNPGEERLLHTMRYDMLLLENQLPFFLLQRIYHIVTTAEENLPIENLAFPSSFEQVALEFFGTTEADFEHLSTAITLQRQLRRTIHHLSHLEHSVITSNYYSAQQPMFETPSKRPCPTMRWLRPRLKTLKTSFPTIPCATELHDLGIKFKISESNEPFHIKFHRGVMEIRPLYLTNWKIARILNHVALERFYFEVEPLFIEYFRFMDLLVDTSNDVVLLRRHDIIHHRIGSDEEVALFFNQLMKGILNDRSSLSSEMYEEVNQYCKIKRHRWRASFMRDYCSTPWSTLSLVAAFILLALTFVQSYMSLHSYFRPPQP